MAIRSPVQAYLEHLHARHRELRDGRVADYIPELAKADPSWFGIAIATVDGHVYEVGDTRRPFTIQSISKPLTYGLAIEDRGVDAVLAKVGVEPTGDAFNSVSLEPGTGRPLNPMINAGAIATASLVAGHSREDTLARLLGVYSLYAGRALTIDEAVYESERETGHRNRAIGHMLRNFDVIDEDPEPALDLYFKQCSIAVDCRDLSLMAATLANGGVHPVTGQRALRRELLAHVLSVMTTCGMYDYAGEWVYRVGMPAKSGVGGGILAVLPGQLGIGVFSPALDARGNSVRGVAVCADLSRELGLHMLRMPRTLHTPIRSRSSVAYLRSKRLRDGAALQLLDEIGGTAAVVELQGELTFAAVEVAVQHLVDLRPPPAVVLLDLRRVRAIYDAALDLLHDLGRRSDADGIRVAFVNVPAHTRLLRVLEERATAAGEAPPASFETLDAALEWAENRLLADAGHDTGADVTVTLGEQDVCHGLSASQLARLEPLLERRTFAAGALIVRKGEAAHEVFLLQRGVVSVCVDLPNGRLERLATLGAGMAFGERAAVGEWTRTADVRADTPVACWVLSTDVLDGLEFTDPSIKLRILENLLRSTAQMLLRTTRELTARTE